VTAGAAYFFWFSIQRNWERGATSETVAAVPLWIPESFALLGLTILSIQLLAYLLRVLAGGQIVDGDKGFSE
jgi:TRAP-type mannitol/chloroaromatic compound transport system permease small subunit